MQISYDKEADALYIQLLDGDFECRVMRSVAASIASSSTALWMMHTRKLHWTSTSA